MLLKSMTNEVGWVNWGAEDWEDLEWVLKTYISEEFPGDADAIGHTFE